MNDPLWTDASHEHRQLLQAFECAEQPLRRAKKILRSIVGAFFDPWESRVQGHIRALRPAYSQPKFLRITLGPSHANVNAVYYYERLSKGPGTLRVYLALVGTSRHMQRSGLGRSAIQTFMEDMGKVARGYDCKSLELTAVVHKNNAPCRALLESIGWTDTGFSKDQPGCTAWLLKGYIG